MSPRKLYQIGRMLGVIALGDAPGRRHLRFWLHSLRKRNTPLGDQHPWITLGAFEWAQEHLQPRMHAFEWGTGGSTLFFAQRVGQLVSVEHDQAWGKLVTQAISRHGVTNCDYHLVPPEPAGDGAGSGENAAAEGPTEADIYHSHAQSLAGMSFERYVRMIDPFPNGHFDFISVDGRAREGCVRHALPKLKPGGYLMLDNSDRPRYQAIHDLLAPHAKTNFAGVGPYRVRPWQTTVWRIEE